MLSSYFLITFLFTAPLKLYSQGKVLTRIEATLLTGANNGDVLDHDSKLTFNFHKGGTFDPWAIKEFYGNYCSGGFTNVNNRKIFEIPLLKSNLLKSDLQANGAKIVINITAVGRDHYSGNLKLKFIYSDGSYDGFDIGDFGIGTFHESNTTGDIALTF